MGEVDTNAREAQLKAYKQAQSFLSVAQGCFSGDREVISDGASPDDIRTIIDDVIERVRVFDNAPQRSYDVLGTLLMIHAVLLDDIEIEDRSIVYSPVKSALELAVFGLSEVIDELESREGPMPNGSHSAQGDRIEMDSSAVR